MGGMFYFFTALTKFRNMVGGVLFIAYLFYTCIRFKNIY